jgi:hypothetical protein
MTELPRVAIVLVTYARTEYAVRTALSVKKNLVYAGETGWYVGDDGSSPEHFRTVLRTLMDVNIFGKHSEDFVPGQRWPGKSWNKAWEAAHDWAPICLWLEDDWKLSRPLDITPYVILLMENEKIGMVRLGGLAINLNMTSMGFNGIHYLQMWRNMQYGFSGNPSLRHKRFAEAYGPYNESVTPGDTELDYDARWRVTSGPEIWWPVEIGGWGVFHHIGQEQSYQ